MGSKSLRRMGLARKPVGLLERSFKDPEKMGKKTKIPRKRLEKHMLGNSFVDINLSLEDSACLFFVLLKSVFVEI